MVYGIYLNEISKPPRYRLFRDDFSHFQLVVRCLSIFRSLHHDNPVRILRILYVRVKSDLGEGDKMSVA